MRARTFLLACALALGCDANGTPDPQLVGAAAPIALTDGLLFTGAASSRTRALTLDVATDEPHAVRHELPEGAVVARARTAGEASEAVLLTTGRDARKVKGKREDAVKSEVAVLNRGAKVASRVLSGRYEGLAVSDDGRFAVAHGPAGSLVLQNAIEVVDLEAPASAPTVVNLQLDGRAPSRFVFSPKVGFNRRLLVIPFPGAIMLLDLEHPDRGEISIPLSVPGDARSFDPQRILFAGDRVFVQSLGSSQVLMVELIAAPETRQGFRPVPSLLTAGSAVNTIALSGAGDSLRLLALGARLEIFDPARGTSTVVDNIAFGAMLPFEGASPVDTTSQPRALLYRPSGSTIGFLDLGSTGAWANTVVEQVELGVAVSSITLLASRKIAIALHSSNSQVSVIDLEQRRVDPYRLDSQLVTHLIDEDARRARIWVLTHAGKLAFIDPAARSAEEVPVVFDGLGSAGQLLLVPGARRRIAVIQNSTAGQVTLLDADADPPTTESALELVGFFLAGLFD